MLPLCDNFYLARVRPTPNPEDGENGQTLADLPGPIAGAYCDWGVSTCSVDGLRFQESITHARLGHDVAWAGGVCLKLPPQVADVHLQQVPLVLIPRSPNLRE